MRGGILARWGNRLSAALVTLALLAVPIALVPPSPPEPSPAFSSDGGNPSPTWDDTPGLLATLDYYPGNFGGFTPTEVAFGLGVGPAGFMSGRPALVGDTLMHADGDVGTFDFTSADDPDFMEASRLLTNGRNDTVELATIMGDGGGGSLGQSESRALGRNPDLVTYSIDFFRLIVHDLSIRGDHVTYNATWEIWGHPLFVAFVPPTDDDGTMLIDRRTTTIKVVLAERGSARLEWDGSNGTVEGGVQTYQVRKASLPNGEHHYRVWAQDEVGGVYHTELRTISLFVGVWNVRRAVAGHSPSLTIDSAGVPHLCHSDGTHLAHSWRAGGWQTEIVDATGWGSMECSIALNRTGGLHIAYEYRAPVLFTASVGHAYQDGPDWNLETVENLGDHSTETSVAIDPVSDRPFIAYYDGAHRALKLAVRTAGVWTNETVDSSGDVGGGPSLAFDGAGNPQVAYYDLLNDSLKYAAWDGTRWQVETVGPNMGGFNKAISLQVDSQSLPHIAVRGWNGTWYVSRNLSAWTFTRVDPEMPESVSLRLDSSDRPRLAYSLYYRPEVRYATYDSEWRVELVSHESYGAVAIALDPDDVPRLVYRNRTEGVGLDYARRVVRGPILIDGDVNFTAENGVGGGSGTPSDPFRIEDWHIDAEAADGVHIRRTTAYYLIKGVSVASGAPAFDGVRLEAAPHGRVENLTVEGDAAGIRVDASPDVVLAGNRIVDNRVGVSVQSSGQIRIYNNTFEDNTVQARDDGGPENSWDAGYPAGGNSWSDYTGIDRCAGPSQDTCQEMDLIGDTPYVIDSDTLDRFPRVPPNAEPIAMFSISEETVLAGDNVTFDATQSRDPDGQVVAYDWDFGDGTTGTGLVASHAFTLGGATTVTLTVTDNRGVLASTSESLSVISFDPFSHHAGFRVPVPHGWLVEQDVDFGSGEPIALMVHGPSYRGYETFIVVDTDTDSTVRETNEYMVELTQSVMDGIREDEPSVVFPESPEYRQIAGHAAVSFVVSYATNGVMEKMAIVVSDEHDRFWILLLAVDSTGYPLMNEVFERMLAGFEITLAPAALLIAAGVGVAAIVIVIILALLYRKRKKVRLVSRTSSPSSIAGPPSCSACGTKVGATDNYCENCGRPVVREPSPPQGEPPAGPPHL